MIEMSDSPGTETPGPTEPGPGRQALGRPVSHPGVGGLGVVAIHGFTGTPASLRPVLDALVAADVPLEAPLLAGHGTVVEAMSDVGWGDWVDDVNRAADALLTRTERLVVIGQSMGGALALAYAIQDPNRVAGVVCINPLTQPRSADEMEMIDDFINSGLEVAPGSGSDIADPDACDVGYDGTPLRALRSALQDGIEPLSARYGEIECPVLVLTSRQDHVVEPSNSVALVEHLSGPVDHVWLERGFHVAAIDFDRDLIVSAIADFLSSVSP